MRTDRKGYNGGTNEMGGPMRIDIKGYSGGTNEMGGPMKTG